MESTTNKASKRYPPEVKERAVRMVLELKAQDPADHTIVSRIARQVGVGGESLRNWVKQAEIDGGSRPGATSTDLAENKALKKEVAELRRANAILKDAAAFFAAAELDRRSSK